MASQSKTKRKNVPKSINEMSKEELQETLKKKKECNAKALEIVEKLCEVDVEENWFLENLQFINQTHFEDVVVERAISKLCGYPLCTQRLEKIPTQQYHISTRYNKVFDITERKNFCSSSCYKSGVYVKNQLFTSPLWFRDQEKIPKYTLLKSLKSSLGEENFFPDKIKLQPDEIKKEAKNKVNINDLEKQCSKLTINNFSSDDLENKNVKECKMNDNNELLEVKDNEIPNTINVEDSKESNSSEFLRLKKSDSIFNSLECIINENKEIVEKKVDIKFSVSDSESHESSEIDKSNKNVKHKTEIVNPVSHVEKCVFEWFSLDSLFYVFSEKKIKELFSDDSARLKEALGSKLKMASYGAKIDRMIQLYGLLDGTSFNSSAKMDLKPLPDYSALKEEGKKLEIKVKAFYHGQLEVKLDKKSETIEEEKKEEPNAENNSIYLPLVDAHSQLPLRRKILLDKLNKVLPDLIRMFSTEYILQMADVRNLIATFSLTAHNITFKPNEWYLVGVILIKLLSLKDKHLEALINEDSSKEQIIIVLKSYELKKEYLDELIQKLTDSANVMQKFHELNK